MLARCISSWVAISFLGVSLAAAQAEKPAPKPAEQPAETYEVNVDDLIAECQQSIRAKQHAGFVWWIPVEFWETSARSQGASAAQATEQFKPLREYVMVAVAVGRMSGMGAFTWTPAADLRANVVVRSANGTEFRPLDQDKINPDAQLLATVLRPVLANVIGAVGQNTEFLFFPARNKEGQLLASPRDKGGFTVVLKGLVGPEESVYEWKTPLTALSPPRYCPTGKERVQANWKYCPWHGTALP